MAKEPIKLMPGADYDYAVAGVIFATREGWIIAQHRDGNTPNSPNLVSFFGGRLEPEDNNPAEGAVREANEETNRTLTLADIEPFYEFIFELRPGVVEKVTLFVTFNQTADGLEVYEGQGYHVIKSPDDPLIAPVVQTAVDKWFAESKKWLDAHNR